MKENKILPDDSTEEIERKKLYARLCADKKPYFFAYNYSSLKTEYDAFIRNASSNAVSLYKKDLDALLAEYENGVLTDENELRFVMDFYYKMPLDRSRSTMNRICWAIEKEFDGVDMFKDVVFDYSRLKSGNDYNEKTFDVINHICLTYKPSVQLAKKKAAIRDEYDSEEDWQSVDIILQNLVESLHANCTNEEELCDILVDLCYGGNIPKQILWKTCGDVIINRLLHAHDYKMYYPQKSERGEFWCQGVQYEMREIVVEGGENNETV